MFGALNHFTTATFYGDQFKDSTPNAFETEINHLDTKKAGMENDIPTKILINTNDIVSSLLSTIYNNSKNATKISNQFKIGRCHTYSQKR